MQMQTNHPPPGAASFPYTEDADPDWIKAAKELGLKTPTITRADCMMVREKTGMRLPRWLMRDPSRRLSRGTYACPELTI